VSLAILAIYPSAEISPYTPSRAAHNVSRRDFQCLHIRNTQAALELFLALRESSGTTQAARERVVPLSVMNGTTQAPPDRVVAKASRVLSEPSCPKRDASRGSKCAAWMAVGAVRQ